ncbi:iron-containing redox enzyme family protein [Kitasatospora viridis]|uniref:Heme oxygenase-like protein n=1 Tax=Kitasatospora viridis TaxID=281105 RepID=A0A561UPA5_9ACTN|nr:iron-containing redox enzyme family protein [Kitasatospora viridis]TWG01207.1 heme oxygenase-like protein [Kitasatospora viridis]
MTEQQELFLLNRAVPDRDVLDRILKIEQNWLPPKLDGLAARAAQVTSREQWLGALAQLLAAEKPGSPAGHYLAESATREQFARVVREFALDGLTEAQNFFPAIPRLPIKAQMAVMRVLIDEFGCGNIARAHSRLYLDLLAELGLPQDLESFLETTADETYGFLNVFYWLAQRAPAVEYFLGALAYLEASIPDAFTVQARACERLGLAHGAYYTEHLHIDTFHREEMQTAIRELQAARGLDASKLWAGALLLSDLLGTAFEAAVERARAEVPA